jgi:hypothetical protein
VESAFVKTPLQRFAGVTFRVLVARRLGICCARAFAAIEARRFDSYERWLDSNDARRGKLTPAERRARRRS